MEEEETLACRSVNRERDKDEGARDRSRPKLE